MTNPIENEKTSEIERSMEELFEAAELTPQELARLFGLPLAAITRAAYAGELKAHIVNHDIISIKREDALAWMANR